MRKHILLCLLLMVGLIMTGCGNDGPIALPDEDGKNVSFENMDKPALVFFFTGNT
ncbi:hypothetical protein [Neobacillus sp. LXY-4]|uniref:hypothetical protein n=1 Tax=Neobacillus sp. LXY-4 TaxID=3379826 RepID=UPI003EE25941